jgi:hypothetical protein
VYKSQAKRCVQRLEIARFSLLEQAHSHKSQLQITLLAHNLDIDTTMTDQWLQHKADMIRTLMMTPWPALLEIARARMPHSEILTASGKL